MASIPGTRPTLPTPVGEAPAHPEGARRDLFACLLSLTAFATPGAEPAIAEEVPAGDGAVPTDVPDGETEEGQDPATDLTLPTVPTDFIPLLAAQAATPVVANPVSTSTKATHAKADKATVNLASATPTVAPTVDNAAGTAAESQAKPVATPMAAAVLPPHAIPHAAIVAGVKPERESEPKADLPITDKEAFEPAKPGQAVILKIPSVAIANCSTTPITGSVPERSTPDRAPTTPTVPIQAVAHGLSERTEQPTTPIQVTLPSAALPNASPVLASLAPAPDAGAPAPSDFTRPAETASPVVERHLDLVRDSEWLDQLARDIVRAGDGDAPIHFKLHPQTLGHLKVELTQGDQGTSVRFTTETETARSIIAEAQPRLAAEARAHGLRIAETHVDLAGSGQDQARDPRRQEDVRAGTPLRTAGQGAEETETSSEPPRARTDRFA